MEDAEIVNALINLRPLKAEENLTRPKSVL